MKLPLLILHNKVSDKWLETCHERIDVQLSRIKLSHEIGEIQRHDFTLHSCNNLNVKYADLIKIVLNTFEVQGVWKEFIVKGTIDTVIGISIYGNTNDVKLVVNMLHFILDGVERYYDVHVEHLRKKRKSRRTKGIRLPKEVDARERTNHNISNKVDKLITLLGGYNIWVRTPIKYKKRDEIIKYLIDSRSLDHRNYRGMNNISIKSVMSRNGIIQLNRVI